MLSEALTDSPLRVAIYRTTSIGDVVLATVCIDLLSRLEQPVEVVWIGRAPTSKVLETAFPSIKVVNFDKSDTARKAWDLTTAIKDCHFLIDLQVNLRSKTFSALAKRRYGIRCFSASKMQVKRNRLILAAKLRGRKAPLPENVRSSPRRQYELMLEPLIRALRWQLPAETFSRLNLAKARPRLTILESESQKPWQMELRVGKWLAIAPGASYAAKKAPLSLFLDVIGRLDGALSSDGDSIGLVFLGDDRDREDALAIAKKMQWSGKQLNLSGKLSLWETALALKECFVLLSNDSSLGHIAEAVGVPVAILFGPTAEAFGFAPWRTESRAHSAGLGCRPCSKHGKTPCRFGDTKCFTSILSEDVAQHLGAILHRVREKSHSMGES